MFKPKPSLMLLVIFQFLISNFAFPQISSSGVDQLVEQARIKFNVPGVAVGIVKGGKVIHNKGYGIKSIETREKVNEHTLFAIASNTKAFTTAALAILVDEGKLSWQDKVVKHIPEFKMYDEYVTQNFNLQDLLTHRSGLGLGAGDLMFWPGGSDFTIKDILNSFQYFEPQSAFRTKYDYDNLLYFVAGEVIARVSGVSWEEFIEIRIMQPLNMENSYSSLTHISDRSNLSTPHSTENSPLKTISHYINNPEIINGAAGMIYSNVDDLCYWMLVHLNKGKYGDNLEKQLFSEKSQREMWKIHTTFNTNPRPPYNTRFSGYGLGWELRDYKGNFGVSHTGGMPGMLSMTMMIPDSTLGIVVLTNSLPGGSGVFASIIYTVMDSYLGLEDFGWVEHIYEISQKRETKADSVVSKVWESVKSANYDHINPKDYIAIYEDNWFGQIEVFLYMGQLWFKSYRSPKLIGPMQYYKANAFAIKWEDQDLNGDAFAIFSLDEEGKAQSIKLKGISPNIDFSFDFQDLDLQRIESK